VRYLCKKEGICNFKIKYGKDDEHNLNEFYGLQCESVILRVKKKNRTGKTY